MEIVPRVPSERVARTVLGVSVVLVSALSFSVAFSFAEFSPAHLMIACAIGAVLAAVLTRPLLKANFASRVEGSLDRFECVAMAAGKSLFVAGLFAVIPRAPIVHGLGVVALVYALGLVVIVMVRDRMRVGFLRRVYAKEHATFRIEREADVRGYELLPPVLSGMITDAVIAHVEPTAATYRTSSGPRPFARVTAALPAMLARLDKRSRIGAALSGVLAMATPVVMTSPLWHPPASPSLLQSVEVPVAPSCADAAPYFSERLQSLEGVGRATLLTHRDDSSIAEGDGVILLVPSTSGVASDAMKSRALAVARSIPCTDKLALTVSDPNLRVFDVDATLTLDASTDDNAALRDAEDQLREIFEPNTRAIFNEHVGFGSTEKVLGYRVRYALKRVAGVKSVKVRFNGSDDDAVLAPRDFPTLGSLKIRVASAP